MGELACWDSTGSAGCGGGGCGSKLGVCFVPYLARVLAHLIPVRRPVRVTLSLGLRGWSLFSGRGGIFLGLEPISFYWTYMYWWGAGHSGRLVAGIGGATCAWRPAAMDGWEGGRWW